MMASSTWAFPLKYGREESKEGLVMLTCTIRPTPASLAARTSVLEFSTAQSKSTSPRENRTQ